MKSQSQLSNYPQLVKQYHNPTTSIARKKQISNKMKSEGILHKSIHGSQDSSRSQYSSSSFSSILIMIFLLLIIIIVIIIIIVLFIHKNKEQETEETENK